jgi:hypothetical protein
MRLVRHTLASGNARKERHSVSLSGVDGSFDINLFTSTAPILLGNKSLANVLKSGKILNLA